LQEQQAQVLLARGKSQKACDLLRRLASEHPGRNQTALALAACLWHGLKKPEEAEVVLLRVFGRAKSMTRAVRALAAYYEARGDLERALGVFKDASKVNTSPGFARAYARYLLRRPTRDRLTRARSLLTPLVRADPRDHRTLALLALLDLEQGDARRAVTRITRALALGPKSRDYLLYQARILARTGNAAQAVEILTALLRKHPKDLQVLQERTRIYCQHRDTRHCLKGAKRLVALGAKREGYLLQGQAHLQRRRPAQAIRAFRKATLIDRHDGWAAFLLGRTLYDEEQYRRAITELQRSLNLTDKGQPCWPDIHYLLGMSYASKGSRRLAEKHLRRYLSTQGNPNNPETAVQKKTASETLKRLAQ
jgi:predicted Zn-dependent protease